MTRAKQDLIIHLNGNYLDDLTAENLLRIEDRAIHSAPHELVMHLSYTDIWLGYSINRQYLISQLTCGDTLNVNNGECTNLKGQPVLKFSRAFLNTIETLKHKGYHLKQVKVNFIMYWKNEEMEQEVKIILPELYFEKEITNLL